MSKIYCANCVFNDVEGQCSRPGGLLYGIRISDAMAEAEHDCTKFQEAVYRATPAGLLWMTMREAGVEVDGGVAKQICDRFFERMMDAGMLKKEGLSDGE